MTAGIEITLAKAAFTGVTRSLGLSRRSLKSRGTTKRTRRALEGGASPSDITAFIGDLDPKAAQQLEEFSASPEVEHLAYCVGTSLLLDKWGRKTDKQVAQLKSQLKRSLELATDLSQSEVSAAAELFFAHISASALAALSTVDSEEIPSQIRASVLNSASSYMHALSKNSDFLNRISTLAAFRDFERDLCSQIKSLNGSMKLPHAGATRQVPYEDLYVQPEVVVEAGSSRGDESLAIDELMSRSLRVVLLGDPGGGKSTLSLKFAYDIASAHASELTQTTPFLVILRDYAIEFQKSRLSLTQYIESVCRTPYAVAPPEQVIEYMLANGRAIVIFDGLDELIDISLRQSVVDAVTGFSYRFPTTPILVTSRRIGYEDAPLDSSLYRIANLEDFEEEQVFEYVEKWFSLDESLTSASREELVSGFKTDSEFVADLRVNPLMLSLMCGIYASENYIPSNRPDVYEKCALLLFERWDKQRGINTALSFDAHVQAAMRSLALWLYPQQASQKGLPRAKLIDFMKAYLREKRFDNDEDAEVAATQFIDFCKGRAWVLTDVGAELYGFTHRTFLEYFAASQLVRLYPDAQLLYEQLEDKILSGGWSVVIQLAIQILNKTVEDGGDNFINMLVVESRRRGRNRGIGSTSRLLSVAAEALEYIVPRASVLVEIVEASVDYWCKGKSIRTSDVVSPDTVITTLLGASKENRPRVSKALYDALLARAEQVGTKSDALGLALHLDLLPGLMSTHPHKPIDRRYWAEELKKNASRFHQAISDAVELPWIGCYLFESGDISAKELLDRYGEGVLMGDGCYDMNLLFPLSYRIPVTTLLRPDMDTRNVDHTDIEQNRSLELIEQLINKPTPWFFVDRREHDRFGGIQPHVIVRHCLMGGHVLPNSTEIVSILIFFLAILSDHDPKVRDWSGLTKRSNQSETESALELMQTVLSRELMRDARIEALRKLNLSSSIELILEEWISGNIKFWYRSSRRKMSTGSTSG